MTCPFCENKEIKERTILKNEFAWAFPTNIPIVPGHILIAPIRCVATWEELKKEEQNAIMKLMETLKNALKKTFDAEGFHVAWNEGRVAGQSVNHFHVHLIPRKKGDAGITAYEPRKFLYRPGSREVSAEGELKQIAELIQKNL